MNDHERNTRALGFLLLVIGLWILMGRFLHLNFGQWLWPFWVIVPGGLLMALGLRDSSRGNDGLVTFGSMVAMTGVILFVQNLTGQWQSWAYAWALIAPGSVGVGQYLWGQRTNDHHAMERGRRAMGTGLIMFLVLGFFFEVILGIGGLHHLLNNMVLPVILIVAGIVLFILAAQGQHPEKKGPGTPPPSPTTPPQPPAPEEKSPSDNP